MKKIEILIFIFFISSSGLIGQTENKKLATAEDFFSCDYFSAALPIYQELLKVDSSDANLNFKIGVCYLNSRSQKTKAVDYLEKAILSFSTVPAAAYKFLGDAYHSTYKFDQAIACYEKFKRVIHDDNDDNLCIKEELEQEIQLCRFGKKLKGLVASRAKLNEDRYFFEDIYISSNADSLPTILFEGPIVSSNVFSEDTTIYNTSNEVTVATSVDGQIVLIYRVDKREGNLYTISLKDNQWTMPEKLNKNINTKGWEPDEFISADGTTLYFASDRKGGYGGKDIYKSKKLPNGKWSKAINLGTSVNTPFDEEAPFIHPDGHSFYFSSNGYKKTHSFDIFTCSLCDSTTRIKPVHVGYPVSTSDNNFLLSADISELKKNNEKTSSKEKEFDDKNNYIITFFNDKKETITLVKGKVVDLSGKAVKDTKITITDNETGDISGIYHPSDESGHYLIILPQGKNNNISYEADGYLFQSENINISEDTNYYETHKTIKMYPITKSSKIVLNNIFFDFDKPALLPVSNVELNKLVQLLSNNPNLKVEIIDYVDSNAKIKSNKKLAMDRTRTVINYLIKKGINKERIIGKGVVKSATNKRKAGAENSKAQSNQRLELKILKSSSKNQFEKSNPSY